VQGSSKVRTIQYLDFSVPGALPWNMLIERIREIEADATSEDDLEKAAEAVEQAAPEDSTVKAILAYLNQRGYQMVSFDRVRRRIDSALSDDRLNELVAKNPTIFRRAVLKEGKPGLAKLVP
jgi:hypothetical protein